MTMTANEAARISAGTVSPNSWASCPAIFLAIPCKRPAVGSSSVPDPQRARMMSLHSVISNSMVAPSAAIAAIASIRGRSFFVLAILVLVKIESNSSAVKEIATDVSGL